MTQFLKGLSHFLLSDLNVFFASQQSDCVLQEQNFIIPYEMRCFEFLSIIGIFYCTQLVSVMSGATSGDVVECVKQSEGAAWFDAPNRRAEERECP